MNDQKPSLTEDEILEKRQNRIFFSLIGFGCAASVAVSTLLEYATARFNPAYNPNDLGVWFLLSVGYYLVALLIGYAVMRSAVSPAVRVFTDAPLRPVPTFLVSLTACGFFIWIASFIGGIFSSGAAQEQASASIESFGDAAVFFLASVVIIPAAEELFWRRAVCGALSDRGGVAAVIISSVTFALSRNDFRNMLSSLAIGLVFGAAYLLTGKFSVPLILHAVVNFLWVFMPALIGSLEPSPELLEELTAAVSTAIQSGEYNFEALRTIATDIPYVMPYLLSSGMISALFDGLALAGPVILFLVRGKIRLPEGGRRISRREIGDVVFLSPGIILYVTLGLFLILLSAFGVSLAL